MDLTDKHPWPLKSLGKKQGKEENTIWLDFFSQKETEDQALTQYMHLMHEDLDLIPGSSMPTKIEKLKLIVIIPQDPTTNLKIIQKIQSMPDITTDK